MRILIIEDNRDLASTMYDYLEAKGHLLDAACDGITAIRLTQVNQYDAIVLDVMLPGMDGIALCRKYREAGNCKTSILMISGRDSVEDKIAGLEAGADDYLAKPVELREVELRLRVLYRRGGGYIQRQKRLVVEDLSLNPFTRSVHRGNRAINLPPIPFKILELLMAHAPNIVKREEIERIIWGEGRADRNSLRAQLHLLRESVDKPYEQKLLCTLRGFGYRIGSPVEQGEHGAMSFDM